MAEGRGREEWSRATPMMIMFANANRDTKSNKVWDATDFSPWAIKDENAAPPVMISIEEAAKIFIAAKPRRE